MDAHADRPPQAGTELSTTENLDGKSLAHGPLGSVLDLSELEATGFSPRDRRDALGGVPRGDPAVGRHHTGS